MRHFVPIGAIVVSCLVSGPPANACDKKEKPAVTSRLDVTPVNFCPSPPCGTPTPPPTGTSEFTRVSTANPLTQIDGTPVPIACFAVQRKKPQFYQLINAEGGQFHRYVSRTGLNDWVDVGAVTGINVASFPWMSGYLCPDFHFESPTSSNATMYFTGFVDDNWNGPTPSPGGGVVMRATSTDDGASWTVDPQPTLLNTTTGWPYMPSYVEYQGAHRLAVAWICTGAEVLELSELRVFESSDGVNWQHISSPDVPTGDCQTGDWDTGSVNRPRLVVDPDGVTLHMFYSGYPWNGTVPTRLNASIGHAISCDGGVTWTKADDPVLMPIDSPSWDTVSTIKPSLTWIDDTQTRLRLYYEGRGPTNGFGASQVFFANFPTPACGPAPRASVAANEIETDVLDLAAAPSGSAGAVTLAIETGALNGIGQATVTVFDVSGRRLRTLYEGSASALPRQVTWDGRDVGGLDAASGRYFVRVEVDGQTVGSEMITRLR